MANARRLVGQEREHKSTEVNAGSEFAEQQLAPVRAWASSLDRASYRAHEAPNGIYVQATPPDDVAEALQASNKDLELANEVTRLFVRYHIEIKKESAEALGPDELVADIATARMLLESPPSRAIHGLWDTPALVAAAALEAHLLNGTALSEEALSYAAEIVLRIGYGEAWPRQFEFEGTLFEAGGDRSAARVLPLLFLPVAAQLRAVLDEENGWTTFEYAFHAGVNLARAVADEVRLHLARGLDHVWKTPCVEHGRCHHELGWQIATETMRFCVLGDWDLEIGQRSILSLEEPFTESLADTAADSLLVSRLDAAIRALAPAAIAGICVSAPARDLLLALLPAQRRSLLNSEQGDRDDRGSHTLVSARALLTLAKDGDDTTIYEHLDAYADNAALLGNLLQGLSAAAEETPDRAATARRIWPNLVLHVLDLSESGHTPFQDAYFGNMTLAALIPNATGGFHLYREVDDAPIVWWDPLELVSEVEAWLGAAAGNAMCVNQLIGFVSALGPDDQVRLGLPMDRETCGCRSQPYRSRRIRTYDMADRMAICRRRCRVLGYLAANRRWLGCRRRHATCALF